MGQILKPAPVKLFTGVLTSLPEIIPDIEKRLTVLFGDVDMRSDEFPFDLTHYYDDEMGSPITRCFFAFRTLISPEEIAGIKMSTNGLEASFAAEITRVRRPVNLDPGYLEQSKIVLASTKNFHHRILLSGGIYGEVTLHYSSGSWQAFPWSFPDFRNGRYDQFFARLRHLYRDQLKTAVRGRERRRA
jgi:hypothetical protein